MSKIPGYEFRGLPQELVDFKDDVTTLINFGKIQPQVVTAAPTWAGRNGEFVWFISNGTGILYVNTADNANAWSGAFQWNL